MLLEVSISAHCLLCLVSTSDVLQVWSSLRCSEACGGAPPGGTSSENVGLAEAVGFIDRVCACALAALRKSTGALASVHQSIFPSKPAPVAVDALAAPFEGNATTLVDYTRAQTVRGSELTFQLLLGHQVVGDFEKVVSDFPRRPDGKTASLSGVKARASQLAAKLVATFEKKIAKAAELAARKNRSQSESAM